MGLQIAFRCEAVYFRATRIGEADEFAHFVETFARSVIDGGAEHLVIQFGADMHKDGVAATHDERNVWLERGEIGRIPDYPGGIEMGFVMIDPDKRPFERECQGLTGFEA